MGKIPVRHSHCQRRDLKTWKETTPFVSEAFHDIFQHRQFMLLHDDEKLELGLLLEDFSAGCPSEYPDFTDVLQSNEKNGSKRPF